MACCETEPRPTDRPALPSARIADTLGESILIFLTLTVMQRVVGFGRGLFFCAWLAPEELGKWEMSLSFMMFAAPIAILSLPGAFGRYLEYYRGRGHFRVFLERTALATLGMSSLATVLVVLCREQVAVAVFGEKSCAGLVGWSAAGLMSMVAVNYSNDLFTAMRLQRICSRLQMIMASTFTVLGIGLLGWYPQGAQSVLIAFVGGSLASFVAGLPYLWHAWRTEPVSAQPVSQAAFWGKLAPYALSIWATNWLGNAFLLSDRYLLIHYSGMGGDESLVQVGQYHIARLVPMLLLTVAGILTSILLPHLSHDWESGSRSVVSHRMNLFIKVLGLGLLATGAAVLLVAPLAFEVVFHGKYALALAVLPCTLGYCVWAALGYVARTYLWCDERVLLGSVAYAVGLVVSVALSLLLIPTYGLFGAVWATSAGNAVVLVLLMVMSIRHGMEVRQGTWLVLATPLALCLGVWAAVPTAIVALIALWKTDWLLSQYEKQHLVEFVKRYYRKLKPAAVDQAPLARP